MKTTKKFISVVILITFPILGGLLTSCNNKKLQEKEKELQELRELAEMDRKEMEKQYAEFAEQYKEMQLSVKDDSLALLLNEEQEHAERLLAELKSVKASSSAEILRLKKELATVRSVLREYIRQVDSLQQTNIRLTEERDRALADVAYSHRQNEALADNNAQLQQTVEVASQLNATGVILSPLKKNGRETTRAKRVKHFNVAFTISRNVTAEVGNRQVYVRLLKPNQMVMGKHGSFTYENKQVEYSAKKTVEYTGQETRVNVVVPVNEYLEKGTYRVFIFCDDEMIGESTTTLK